MKKSIVVLVLIWIAISHPQNTFSAVIHVPGDSATIQSGIDGALEGDTILVADGVYIDEGNRDIDFRGKGVVLKSENGPQATIIDCQADSLNPHRGFFFQTGESSTSIIDGFIIQNAYSSLLKDTVSGDSGWVAGGIFCLSSSPAIKNCILKNNTAIDGGGGLWCGLNSSPIVINCTFTGNHSLKGGGGLYCTENSSPTLEGCVFEENTTGLSAFGGAAGLVRSSPTFIDCIFENNSADRGGGGIACEDEVYSNLSNCTFIGNSAYDGGGIFVQFSSPIIENCDFIGNSAINEGGGIDCLYDSSTTIEACTFDANSADSGGGGVNNTGAYQTIITDGVFKNNSSINKGGGLRCWNSSPILTNCTFGGNSAASDSGAGIYCNGDSSPNLINSIIAFSSNGNAVSCGDFGGNPLLTCCNIFGNEGGDWQGCIEGQGTLNGNFSSNPLFCDTSSGDFRINEESPCAPANNSCSILIGALGLGCNICGNANGDDLVNVGDAVFLINYIFREGPAPDPVCIGDANADGLTNVGDAVYIINYIWREGPPPDENCCP